ncbi:uL15 family ribosomal protein [Pyrofollis japonicus]|uniref:uL15m family ribosomal protein n=1 Tax=Pyrofollis japonicus TaxID=3060460 RepID=UPI00295A8C41|nr:uL15 family ribosomal protein [Pyrofollis japonicus]BEP17514.1 uL15 family ribosomal protein [Pyrofollis japonicus]
MVVRRRKKSRKLRGRTRTMGWGRIGQHRGSGSRGGFGAAGMHKHMWTWVVKYAPTWFGKHGFNQPLKYQIRTEEINVGELAELVDKLAAAGKLEKENDKYVVNLAEMGYYKLLGRGKIKQPVKVIVPEATELAIKKIEEAGGEVVLPRKAEA